MLPCRSSALLRLSKGTAHAAGSEGAFSASCSIPLHCLLSRPASSASAKGGSGNTSPQPHASSRPSRKHAIEIAWGVSTSLLKPALSLFSRGVLAEAGAASSAEEAPLPEGALSSEAWALLDDILTVSGSGRSDAVPMSPPSGASAGPSEVSPAAEASRSSQLEDLLLGQAHTVLHGGPSFRFPAASISQGWQQALGAASVLLGVGSQVPSLLPEAAAALTAGTEQPGQHAAAVAMHAGAVPSSSSSSSHAPSASWTFPSARQRLLAVRSAAAAKLVLALGEAPFSSMLAGDAALPAGTGAELSCSRGAQALRAAAGAVLRVATALQEQDEPAAAAWLLLWYARSLHAADRLPALLLLSRSSEAVSASSDTSGVGLPSSPSPSSNAAMPLLSAAPLTIAETGSLLQLYSRAAETIAPFAPALLLPLQRLEQGATPLSLSLSPPSSSSPSALPLCLPLSQLLQQSRQESELLLLSPRSRSGRSSSSSSSADASPPLQPSSLSKLTCALVETVARATVPCLQLSPGPEREELLQLLRQQGMRVKLKKGLRWQPMPLPLPAALQQQLAGGASAGAAVAGPVAKGERKKLASPPAAAGTVPPPPLLLPLQGAVALLLSPDSRVSAAAIYPSSSTSPSSLHQGAAAALASHLEELPAAHAGKLLQESGVRLQECTAAAASLARLHFKLQSSSSSSSSSSPASTALQCLTAAVCEAFTPADVAGLVSQAGSAGTAVALQLLNEGASVLRALGRGSSGRGRSRRASGQRSGEGVASSYGSLLLSCRAALPLSSLSAEAQEQLARGLVDLLCLLLPALQSSGSMPPPRELLAALQWLQHGPLVHSLSPSRQLRLALALSSLLEHEREGLQGPATAASPLLLLSSVMQQALHSGSESVLQQLGLRDGCSSRRGGEGASRKDRGESWSTGERELLLELAALDLSTASAAVASHLHLLQLQATAAGLARLEEQAQAARPVQKGWNGSERLAGCKEEEEEAAAFDPLQSLRLARKLTACCFGETAGCGTAAAAPPAAALAAAEEAIAHFCSSCLSELALRLEQAVPSQEQQGEGGAAPAGASSRTVASNTAASADFLQGHLLASEAAAALVAAKQRKEGVAASASSTQQLLQLLISSAALLEAEPAGLQAHHHPARSSSSSQSSTSSAAGTLSMPVSSGRSARLLEGMQLQASQSLLQLLCEASRDLSCSLSAGIAGLSLSPLRLLLSPADSSFSSRGGEAAFAAAVGRGASLLTGGEAALFSLACRHALPAAGAGAGAAAGAAPLGRREGRKAEGASKKGKEARNSMEEQLSPAALAAAGIAPYSTVAAALQALQQLLAAVCDFQAGDYRLQSLLTVARSSQGEAAAAGGGTAAGGVTAAQQGIFVPMALVPVSTDTEETEASLSAAADVSHDGPSPAADTPVLPLCFLLEGSPSAEPAAVRELQKQGWRVAILSSRLWLGLAARADGGSSETAEEGSNATGLKSKQRSLQLAASAQHALLSHVLLGCTGEEPLLTLSPSKAGSGNAPMSRQLLLDMRGRMHRRALLQGHADFGSPLSLQDFLQADSHVQDASGGMLQEQLAAGAIGQALLSRYSMQGSTALRSQSAAATSNPRSEQDRRERRSLASAVEGGEAAAGFLPAGASLERLLAAPLALEEDRVGRVRSFRSVAGSPLHQQASLQDATGSQQSRKVGSAMRQLSTLLTDDSMQGMEQQ